MRISFSFRFLKNSHFQLYHHCICTKRCLLLAGLNIQPSGGQTDSSQESLDHAQSLCPVTDEAIPTSGYYKNNQDAMKRPSIGQLLGDPRTRDMVSRVEVVWDNPGLSEGGLVYREESSVLSVSVGGEQQSVRSVSRKRLGLHYFLFHIQ